jgi:hypothetical protein
MVSGSQAIVTGVRRDAKQAPKRVGEYCGGGLKFLPGPLLADQPVPARRGPARRVNDATISEERHDRVDVVGRAYRSLRTTSTTTPMSRANAPTWTSTATPVLASSVALRREPNKSVPAKKTTRVQSSVAFRMSTDATVIEPGQVAG